MRVKLIATIVVFVLSVVICVCAMHFVFSIIARMETLSMVVLEQMVAGNEAGARETLSQLALNWEESGEWSLQSLVEEHLRELRKESIKVQVSKVDETSIQGVVSYSPDGQGMSTNFSLSKDDPDFLTPFQSVTYGVQLRIGGKLFEKRDPDIYKKTRKKMFAHGGYAPPANNYRIKACNRALQRAGLPELPAGYANFLRTANGFAFNTVELRGTERLLFPESDYVMPDIIDLNEELHAEYDDYEYFNGKALLWFGRDNDDYYAYNTENGMYETHNHEMINEVWEEYDSFEEFFVEVCGKYA
jgi:hypothetical protein